MSKMKEVYEEVIQLWRTGGTAGIYRAKEYLKSLGYDEKEATQQLLGAIHIFKGWQSGVTDGTEATERPDVHPRRQSRARAHDPAR